MSQRPARRMIRVLNAFEQFIYSQTFGGVLLIFCTIIALIWANSPQAGIYFGINHTDFGLHIESLNFDMQVHAWINDGLMAIFFLLVGLEIKRELAIGELSAWDKALLPIGAAIGGMVFPALIFVLFNAKHTSLSGWAIPCATDIAFALGILSLLSKRIPKSLIVFLSAIAIADDLGAVIIIALFYTAQIHQMFLLMALFFFLILLTLNYFGVYKLRYYLFFGLLLWMALLNSGVHATIAGVLIAMSIPVRTEHNPQAITDTLNALMNRLCVVKKASEKQEKEQLEIIHSIESLVHHVESPLQRLEHSLHALVTYLIIPIFVLFNAGVSFQDISFHQAIAHPLTLGIIFGLLFGKTIGIFLSSYVLVKLRWVSLPKGLNLKLIFPTSILAGIGFTMSIFIAELAFPNQIQLLPLAKTGILIASLIAGVAGFVLLYIFSAQSKPRPLDTLNFEGHAD